MDAQLQTFSYTVAPKLSEIAPLKSPPAGATKHLVTFMRKHPNYADSLRECKNQKM